MHGIPAGIAKSSSHYPPLTVIVVGTQKGTDFEYRVGAVLAMDFAIGFRLRDGTLNPDVAARCFSASKVFDSNPDAEDAAKALCDVLYKEVYDEYLTQHFSRNISDVESNAVAEACKKITGVKIFHFMHPWPL